MSDFGLVDCANCGQQTEIDRDKPGDTCLFCGKPANKKEDIVVKIYEMGERTPIPDKPKGKKAVWAYYEKHKEAIIADYQSMKTREFLWRWGMASVTWAKLRTLWDVESKKMPASPPPKEKPEKPLVEDTAPLTEHERYLILLGYQQAVREVLKSR